MSDSRYSTARWKSRRAELLAREPLCRLCKQVGRLTPATVADHIRPHRGDAEMFWYGELQALCETCHNATKKAQECGSGLRGCDSRGIPLDPEHHWH